MSSIEQVSDNGDGTCDVTCKSVLDGKLYHQTMRVSFDKIRQYAMRPEGLIQEVFPELDPNDREFILSGINPEIWESTLNPDRPLIIYHANCTDGFGAAYAAWCAFGSRAEYVPSNYGDCVVSGDSISVKDKNYVVTDREVHILDFSLPPSEMQLLLKAAGHVTWIDHHKSAILDWMGQDYDLGVPVEMISENCHLILDNSHSGAWLSWVIYHPDLEVPKLIEHIEDRDLWKFNLSNTKEIIEGLRNIPRQFENWGVYMETGVGLLKEMGEVLCQATERRCKALVSRAPKVIQLNGINFVAANVVEDISEAGHALNDKYGAPSCTFFIKDNEVICSLRSQDSIDVDVSTVAKVYGGGGHRNAAGFKMGVSRFFTEVWV